VPAIRRPNIVLFMADQLRADALGCMGNGAVETPHLDRLAAEGIGLPNTFVQHTVCTPSRCSIFSGLYPHTRGYRSLYYLLHREEPNLFKTLKLAGYHVEMIGKNDLFTAESFADSVSHRATRTWKNMPNPWPDDHRLHDTFYYGLRPSEFDPDHDRTILDAALQFLGSHPPEPFCLFLPLIQPHPPYMVQEPWYSRVDRAKVAPPIPPILQGKARFHRVLHEVQGTKNMRPDEIIDMVATYGGMTMRLDDMLGELLGRLEATGLEPRTAVAAFSDHGDYCGDYGLTEKWWIGLEDCLTRVPLILRAPGLPARGVLNPLVEMLDIYATICDLAGVTPAHDHFSRSLLPLWQGRAASHRNAVFAEGGHRPCEQHCLEDLFLPASNLYHHKTRVQREDPTLLGKSTMVRTCDWKYVRRTCDPDELYDLRADPREELNLADRAEYADIIRRMRDRMLDWYIETCDVVPLEHDVRDLDKPAR
jgi:arylsulfatase A-like enzyme